MKVANIITQFYVNACHSDIIIYIYSQKSENQETTILLISLLSVNT
jgi:hypothetical protein